MKEIAEHRSRSMERASRSSAPDRRGTADAGATAEKPDWDASTAAGDTHKSAASEGDKQHVPRQKIANPTVLRENKQNGRRMRTEMDAVPGSYQAVTRKLLGSARKAPSSLSSCASLPPTEFALMGLLASSTKGSLRRYSLGLKVLGKSAAHHAPTVPRYLMVPDLSTPGVTGWTSCRPNNIR